SASATTPLIMENTMIGTTFTRPTSPSASPLRSGTSSDTCHSSAAFCIIEPVNDRNNPAQIRRKLRWRRATNDAAEITNAPRGTFLSHSEQLDVEHERRMGRDRAAGAARAVAQGGRNHECTRTAYLHAGNALIPTANHHARTELELERLAMIFRTVELLAVFVRGLRVVQPTRVMYRDRAAGFCFGAIPDRNIRDLQARDVVHSGSRLRGESRKSSNWVIW